MLGVGKNTGSLRKALVVAAAVAVTAGCSELDVLEVNDPDVVTPEQSSGPAAVPIKIAGGINTFREAYEHYAYEVSLLTDEFLLAGTFPTRVEIDERNPSPSNVTINGMWQDLQVARRTNDDNVLLFEKQIDNPDWSSVKSNMQRGLALGNLLAGYTRILLAEGFCQSIVTEPESLQEGSPLEPPARMQDAISSFQKAIEWAGKAGLTGGATDAESAARVGIARAHMFLGNYDQAASAASQVPTEMQFNIDYSTNSTAEFNELFGITWGEDTDALRITVGDGTDPSRHNEKYAYFDEWVDQNLLIPEGLHGKDAFGSQTRPVNLQTVFGDPTTNPNGRDTSIPLATGWEAQMIEAEVLLRNGQPEAAEDMVNALLEDPTMNPMARVEPGLRDTPGPAGNVMTGFEPVDLGDESLEGDLRDMARAYAAGLFAQTHRQHMLRRLFRNDGINMYPQGPTVGNSMSLPVPRQELVNNTRIETGCPGGNIPGQG